MRSTLSSQQLPHCQVCNLQPVPESTQHLILIIIEVALLFVNFKFSLILLMIGYSFPKTVWKCPFCSRQVQSVSKDNKIENNIILRLGNCMALFSLDKFRIFAVIVIVICGYFYSTQTPVYDVTQKVKIQNTWESLVSNCGYQAYMDNSYRANHLYSLYEDSGVWELQGIFLKQVPTQYADYYNIHIKMSPTQFKDPDAEDFRVFVKIPKKRPDQLKRGDLLKIRGEWKGRQQWHMIFTPTQIKKTALTKDPSNVVYIYKQNSMLRTHFDQVKKQYIEQEKTNQVETNSKTEKN